MRSPTRYGPLATGRASYASFLSCRAGTGANAGVETTAPKSATAARRLNRTVRASTHRTDSSPLPALLPPV